ncbi:MAG: FeoA family protein [Thermoanaerobaculia bacterium]
MVQAVVSLFRKERKRVAAFSCGLQALTLGSEGIVDSLQIPPGAAQRLQELGFVPGARVFAAWSAPGGDPRVYRLDGMEVALRRETAEKILLRNEERSSVVG